MQIKEMGKKDIFILSSVFLFCCLLWCQFYHRQSVLHWHWYLFLLVFIIDFLSLVCLSIFCVSLGLFLNHRGSFSRWMTDEVRKSVDAEQLVITVFCFNINGRSTDFNRLVLCSGCHHWADTWLHCRSCLVKTGLCRFLCCLWQVWWGWAHPNVPPVLQAFDGYCRSPGEV